MNNNWDLLAFLTCSPISYADASGSVQEARLHHVPQRAETRCISDRSSERFIAVRYEIVDACHQYDKTLPCGRESHVVLELRNVLSNKAEETVFGRSLSDPPRYSTTVHLSTTSCWLFVNGCYRCLRPCCLPGRGCQRYLPSSALLDEHSLPSAYNRCRSHVCVYLYH